MNAQQMTIVVVGGVAGGASAATRARRMNERAQIVLFEKDEHVSFANCGLRDRLGELDAAEPTVVSCAVGLRGHVAARILRQSGFADVANLSGGATVRNRTQRAENHGVLQRAANGNRRL